MGLLLLKKQIASSSTDITFTLSGSFDEYILEFVNLRPSVDNVDFVFQAGSGYNTTAYTSYFRANSYQNSSTYDLSYQSNYDAFATTSDIILARELGTDSDQTLCGTFTFYSPKNTAYEKLFSCEITSNLYADIAEKVHVSGTFATTSAISTIRFKFASGNIDTGAIALYGLE